MPENGLLIIAGAVFAYALIARRLSAWIITPPLAFLAIGYFLDVTYLIRPGSADAVLETLAEATLVIVLFSDAAMIDLKALRKDHGWPVRTLLLGMPLCAAFGTLVVVVAFPSWTIWEAALLAAILAPTDAALGLAVVTNPVVPERVRRALTVESGLNDGLALPLILFLGCAAAGVQHQNAQDGWFVFAATQIGLGALAGAIVGYGGGWLMRLAADRGWSGEAFEGIGVLALAGIAYLFATSAGGNGFIAAFVGGLAFGHVVEGRCRFVFEFMEAEGQALVLLTFLLLGAAFLPVALDQLDAATLAVISASLFVVRPAAIWLSLAGSDAAPLTRAFIGWFGPRGLATALFALFIVAEIKVLNVGPMIVSVAVAVVGTSALLHGITAAPGARWYGRRIGRVADSVEHMPVERSARPIRTHGA